MRLDLIASATSPKGKTLEYYTSCLVNAFDKGQLNPMAERIKKHWAKMHPKSIIDIKIEIS